MIRMEAVYQKVDEYSKNADQEKSKEKDSEIMKFIKENPIIRRDDDTVKS